MISEESITSIPDIAAMRQASDAYKPVYLKAIVDEINKAIQEAAAAGYNQVTSPWYDTVKCEVGAPNWNNRLLPSDAHAIVVAYETRGYKVEVSDRGVEDGAVFKISW